MDKCSYFINNKALFGSYPSQQDVDELEGIGVRFFIDLTCYNESNLTKYDTNYNYISFPIPDRNIPSDIRLFSYFVTRVVSIIKSIKQGEKIYIHCKGGHGRSGILVASIICYMNKISSHESIKETTYYHSKRVVMHDKWRRIGSPQTFQQKRFVHNLFEPIILYRLSYHSINKVVNQVLDKPIYVEGVGKFISLDICIHTLKKIKYNNINKFKLKIDLSPDIDIIIVNLLYKIFKNIFDKNIYLMNILLNTGLCPIIVDRVKYMDNKIGIILMNIRRHYYKNIRF